MGETTKKASTTGVFVVPVDKRGKSLTDPIFVGPALVAPTFVGGIVQADKEGVIRPGQRVLVFAGAINPRARQLTIPAPGQRTTLGIGFLRSGPISQ